MGHFIEQIMSRDELWLMSLGRLDLRRSLEVEDEKRKLKQPVTPRSESPSPREGHLHLWCRILELGIRLAVQTHDSGFLNPVNLALGRAEMAIHVSRLFVRPGSTSSKFQKMVAADGADEVCVHGHETTLRPSIVLPCGARVSRLAHGGERVPMVQPVELLLREHRRGRRLFALRRHGRGATCPKFQKLEVMAMDAVAPKRDGRRGRTVPGGGGGSNEHAMLVGARARGGPLGKSAMTSTGQASAGVQSVMVAGEESAMAQLLPPDGGVLQLARVRHLAMGPRGSGVHEPCPSVPLMLTERYLYSALPTLSMRETTTTKEEDRGMASC
ncbi:uncharacterized protein C2845_PM12G06420 [Panicum miliaceum]|uniref:Uncharacterized protein n=1 Tax=Panicum miliaceum TaxID=4540 RepID=A0A3L6QFS9_PANMI|nr:uncharacterized protein C2845_PM12G06420 [Panicum miliaceum]